MDRGHSQAQVVHDPKASLEVRCPRAGTQPPLEIGATHQVHHEVGPGAMLTKGVNCDDVGMVDSGHEARFPDEVLSNFWIKQVAPNHLDGHLAVEALVNGEENGAYRAPPNQLD